MRFGRPETALLAVTGSTFAAAVRSPAFRGIADLCETFGLAPKEETPGRQVIRHLGASLVKAIEMSMESGEPEAAEIVACERMVLAGTKDRLNWELLSQCDEKAKGEKARALKEACEEIEEEEDERLYHSKGWSRELRIASLGMPAVTLPPEEEKEVKTASGLRVRRKRARRRSRNN